MNSAMNIQNIRNGKILFVLQRYTRPSSETTFTELNPMMGMLDTPFFWPRESKEIEIFLLHTYTALYRRRGDSGKELPNRGRQWYCWWRNECIFMLRLTTLVVYLIVGVLLVDVNNTLKMSMLRFGMMWKCEYKLERKWKVKLLLA